MVFNNGDMNILGELRDHELRIAKLEAMINAIQTKLPKGFTQAEADGIQKETDELFHKKYPHVIIEKQ